MCICNQEIQCFSCDRRVYINIVHHARRRNLQSQRRMETILASDTSKDESEPNQLK